MDGGDTFAAIWKQERGEHGRVAVAAPWLVLEGEAQVERRPLAEVADISRASNGHRLNGLPTLNLTFTGGETLAVAPLGFGELSRLIDVLRRALPALDSRC